MASTVRDTASSGVESAKEGLSRVGDAVSGAASSASETAGSLYRRTTGAAGSVGETLSHSTDSARRMLHDGRDDAAHLGSKARRRVREVFDDQPLVVAALGLAIGAALPRSRAEDELMGDAAERAREAARDVAEAGYRQARDIVEDTMRHVTEELSERGLSTDAVREAAEAAAEKAREAAMRAVGGEGSRDGAPGQRRGQATGERSARGFGQDRATGGEGYAPPRQGTAQEGMGNLRRAPGDAAPGTRAGPAT
jgi:hypothetical protein